MNSDLASTQPNNFSVLIELTLFNESQFGKGDQIIYDFKRWSVLAFVLLGAYYSRKFVREMSKDYAETNFAFTTVCVCIPLKVSGLLFEWVGLAIFSIDGSSNLLVEFLAQSLNVVTGYMLTLVVIFLGAGWTITFPRIDDMPVLLPVAIAVGILKLFVLGISKLVHNPVHHFHPYDTFVGAAFTAANLGLFLYYCLTVRSHLPAIRKDPKLKRFYVGLTLAATVYLNHFPILYILTMFVDSTKRCAYVECGQIICQFGAVVGLSYLLKGKKGVYSDIADFDLSLPTAKPSNN